MLATVVYTAVTLASGNLVLGFAALFLGVVSARQRRTSGDVGDPDSRTWSVATRYALPAIFG